mmetsp:Transcript_31097/g.50101  ORF Transcript_31097/g.50101 Transcript_31097/m.50101 type:complete len:691 (+) Transcript_31097:367-2439(+)
MFEDSELGVICVKSVWRSQICKEDKSVGTRARKSRNRASQTSRPTVTMATQTEQQYLPEEEGEGKSLSSTIPLDNKILQQFILRVGPLMEHELKEASESRAFDGYKVVWEEERDTINKMYTLTDQDKIRRNKQQEKGANTNSSSSNSNSSRPLAQSFSDVEWSCNGSVLAASFGERHHVGWCEHDSFVACWSIMSRRLNSKKPDMKLPVPCCVGCLAFHPTQPTILAAGLFSGEIRVWNISGSDGGGGGGVESSEQEDDPLIATSPVDDHFHREPITQISWIATARGDYRLASISCDGLVLFWRLSDKLKYPLYGSSILPNDQYHGHGVKRNNSSYKILGGVSMAFSKLDFVNYVVGTEGGGVLRCERKMRSYKKKKKQIYKDTNLLKWDHEVEQVLRFLPRRSRDSVKNSMRKYATKTGAKIIRLEELYASRPNPLHLFPPASKQAFEKHGGPVYGIAASPFHRNIFLTCSTDGSLRLYNMLRNPRPVVLMEPSPAYLFDVQWSTSRPLVFAVADATGKIHIYDLGVETISPIISFQASSSSSSSVVESIGSKKGGIRRLADNATTTTTTTTTATTPTQQDNKRTPPTSSSSSSSSSSSFDGAGAIVALSFSPRDGSILAGADDSGQVVVWRLSTRLSSIQEGELALLESLGAVDDEDQKLQASRRHNRSSSSSSSSISRTSGPEEKEK